MIRQFLISIFLIVSFSSFLQAQGIRGKITDWKGEPVSFASIYVPKLSTGTTSNIDGIYELKLPGGQWNVLFQYLGYQTQSKEVLIGQSFQILNITLENQNYQIPEIKVLASGEDPAYYIMRRAIAMAPYYQKQVSKYTCKVYLKGSGVFDKIPKLLEKQMKKSGVKENEAFVAETVSKIEFELPDKLKQQVLAMRSSGKDNNTSPMNMITNNLYDADKYGVISPVGKSALKTYRFRLDGVFEDQGRVINKIRVMPKVQSKDVFTGYIYIADLFWNIHSADLHMRLPMTDVNVHQVYGEVNKNTWMPVSLDFDMDLSGMGFKMRFRYVASVSEYQTTLNPALDHSFLEKLKSQQLHEQQMVEQFQAEALKKEEEHERTRSQQKIEALMQKAELNNRETVKLNRLIDTEARRNAPPEPLEIKSNIQVSQKQVNNDSAYWETLRPIPLTESERTSFAQKDSFIRVSVRPEYQDSVRDAQRKFRLKHLVLGKTYNYSVDSARKRERLTIPRLIAPGTLAFNSVDGLRVELPFNYFRADSSGRSLSLHQEFGYAIAREKLDATFAVNLVTNSIARNLYNFSLGSTTADYNGQSGISSMNNDFYTLWLEENYKRFFRRDFVQFGYGRDLINGLNMNIGFGYNENSPLENHSSYSFIDYDDKQIQPNVPVNSTLIAGQLDRHQSFGAHLSLEYTPRHRYRIRDNRKFYAGSKYPTFSMLYRGAFSGIFGSDSRYDFMKLGIRQRLNFGISDQFSYIVQAGGFLNSEKLYFENYQHFNTQPMGFMFNNSPNSFRLLPFYEFSTRKSFAEAHADWQSRKFILKQLPLFRNSTLSEQVFLNFLSTPDLKNYLELGYGLKNIFLLMNVDAVAGFENGKFRSAGLRISLNLN